eukprot:1392938-Pyramimonas_sp.AAC.1
MADLTWCSKEGLKGREKGGDLALGCLQTRVGPSRSLFHFAEDSAEIGDVSQCPQCHRHAP